MTVSAIDLLRWALLLSAGINLFLATLFFRRWIAFVDRIRRIGSESRPSDTPPHLREEVQRAWMGFMTVLFLGLWWYLGTSEARETWSSMM